MDNSTIAIIVSAVLAAAALAWTVVGYQQLRGSRRLLRGVGLVLLPIGLWLTGVMELLVSGIRGVVDFFRTTVMDSMIVSGLVVAGLGLLLVLGASLVKPVSKEEARERRLARDTRRRQLGAGSHQADATETRGRGAAVERTPAAGRSHAPATTPPAAAGRGAAPRGGMDSEDAEIEALLRKRGIE